MAELPSGTVSLLFSDIEGSTVLLSRLGPAYAEALDGQRLLLRQAWANHGGTELGTEGDSFFVVFPTAEDAIAAAAQAQRELAAYDWPGGEPVRVRMGIHTGTPTVHDGGYVGMDVHRAARIAGSAHGGQVVISSATAELVRSCLPERVDLRDLGSHQLKDIAHPERLFQLVIEGLRNEFPELKTLGTAASLPRPATPLVGREGELAELSVLLSSPEVRLVTLTGPGGSGKSRLAIALAQELVERFVDGVYFVPLAAVSDADVMWTSVAEVLDVPPEGRTPPELFTHVAHRSVLFVLDNLEQIDGADTVVSELLEHAVQAVAIVTSRKPLAVEAEHVHPVPPLALPKEPTLPLAETSGAVQLFVQRARKVKPAFKLTGENAADVVEVCRRLDGLPLAIEIAAARVRLLSPKALLSRLDRALDISATGRQGPGRQHTLRDTIAWSYDLLPPTQQAFFRCLGVFAGGADLDAITFVTADMVHGCDPFDLLADIADASLVTIAEGLYGEPRVGMLETIRAYALDRLAAATEIETVRDAHAKHYLGLAERLWTMAYSRQRLEAHTLAELELDNFREALGWTLPQGIRQDPEANRLALGQKLAVRLYWLWFTGGYMAEGRVWYERAIEGAADYSSTDLLTCVRALARILVRQGEPRRALDLAVTGLAIARQLDDDHHVAAVLEVLAQAQQELGDLDAARSSLEEARALSRHSDENYQGQIICGLAELEATPDRKVERWREALSLYQRSGNVYGATAIEAVLAHLLAINGQVHAANEQVRRQVEAVLMQRDPGLTVMLADTYVDILVRLGHTQWAARLLGAAEAMRERYGEVRGANEQAEIAAATLTPKQMAPEDWEHEYQLGYSQIVEDLLRQFTSEAPTASVPDQPEAG